MDGDPEIPRRARTKNAPPVWKDPSFRRSVALFRAFMREQDDPEGCYSLLARDAADQVEAYG
ncbi:SAM-dependent methyltransferase, partial [Streptomyces mirabilis]